MLAVVALILGLGLAVPEAMAPSLSVDLDGDGTAETATADARGGTVRLQVRDGAKKKTVDAKAPAPGGDVVRVSLTAAPLGSVGSLLEVLASTDASECLSVWRFHGAALTRIPIRGEGGKALPDCAIPGEWKHRWEREAADAPSALIRERTEKVERGTLKRRETYVFAGFSLDRDPRRSGAEIDGLPIPAWYDARFYTRLGLDRLYTRFNLQSFRATPQLHIVTDRDRGVFTLLFLTPTGEIAAPVESYSAVAPDRTAFLVARAGAKTVHARIQLAGDGTVPIEIRVEGLAPEVDTIFAPAGTFHNRARQVFSSAADEIASQHLGGAWMGTNGVTVQLQAEGAPPYRLRMDKSLFTLDFEHPANAADMTLRPTDGSHRGWGLVLQGPNAVDRFPLSCDGDAVGGCQADGPVERLRRLGARINVN